MSDEKFAQVVRKLDPPYRLLRSWPLTGGASAVMIALEIALPDGGGTKTVILRQPGDYALKQNPHAAVDEFRLLKILHNAALPTPTPYVVDESGEILPTPYLVIEYIDGQSEFAPADLSDYVAQVADELAQVHSLDTTSLDLSFLPNQTRTITERFGARPATLDTASIEARIWEALEPVGTIPQVNPSVLLHGDFWPGNLLWRDGRLVALIDWEDATLGDPLADFAISRFDTALFFGQKAMQNFTQHYQSAMPELDFTYLPYWDLCAALRAAPNVEAWSADFPSLGRLDITETTMRESLNAFVAQALEKLSKGVSLY